MSIGLATDGYYGSGGTNDGDTEPPIISPLSPLPGVAPGDVGGFEPDPATASTTPIVIDITDLDPGLQLVTVLLRYNADDSEQIIYRQATFRPGFTTQSFESSIANGLQLSILPDEDWSSSYVLIDIDATDLAGNVATASFVYQLPDVAPAVLDIPAAVPGSRDHVAAALDRLREQFRSYDEIIVRSSPTAQAASKAIAGSSATLRIFARATGVGGNSILLANDDASGPNPPIVSDSGLMVSLSSSDISTFAGVASAINSGSSLIRAELTGDGTENFTSVTGLFSGTLSGGTN